MRPVQTKARAVMQPVQATASSGAQGRADEYGESGELHGDIGGLKRMRGGGGEEGSGWHRDARAKRAYDGSDDRSWCTRGGEGDGSGGWERAGAASRVVRDAHRGWPAGGEGGGWGRRDDVSGLGSCNRDRDRERDWDRGRERDRERDRDRDRDRDRERERGADTDRVKRRYNDKYAHRDSDGARYGDRERDADGARGCRERDRARH